MIPQKRLRFVDLTASSAHLALLSRFYDEVFLPGFPDPDEREQLSTFAAHLARKDAHRYGMDGHHVVLCMVADQIAGGIVVDYLAEPNFGVIEYIVTDEAHRGQGFGRYLHQEAVRLVNFDAAAAGNGPVRGLLIEVDDPRRAPQMAGAEPVARLERWHRWGYQRLCFPYEQPALSNEQNPVDYLLLAVKLFDRTLEPDFPSRLADQLVRGYIRLASDIDLALSDPLHSAISRHLESRDTATLQPLDQYLTEGIAPAAEPAPSASVF